MPNSKVILNKADLILGITALYKGRISETDIRLIVEDFLLLVSAGISEGYRVRLKNFGTFTPSDCQTNLGPCTKVTFKMGQQMKRGARERRTKENRDRDRDSS